MFFNRLLCGGALLCATAIMSSARAESPPEQALQDVIIVTSPRLSNSITSSVAPDAVPVTGADATALVARLPGAAVIDNGGISGQVQYHGFFGPRVAIRIDGQSFESGGPNLMDPPLHYAPMPLISRIEIDRGVSPVSKGVGLGGGIDTVFKRTEFNDGSELTPGFDITASGRSADNSYAIGGVAGLASDHLRFNVLGSIEDGGDVDFPGGTIAASRHERKVYGLSGGAKYGDHEIAIDARHQDTGPTGNPPFAMDIQFVDTDFAKLHYIASFDDTRIELSLSYADVSHGMNNFSLRPAPASPMNYRTTFADARTWNGGIKLIVDAMSGELRIGADDTSADKDVVITNPNNAMFFVGSLPDVQMDRIGAFVEWQGAIAGTNAEIGARIDRHKQKAGTALLGAAVPMGPKNLAAMFNAADHRWSDTTYDVVARLWRQINQPLTWRLTLARKMRVPGYVERFSWLPTEASSGLADGNTYVGDLNLKSETAWIAETGFDWRTQSAYARPTVFYRRIDNFIQGIPFDATPGIVDSAVEMVSAMNGDTTPLKFANVDAEFYGIDMGFGGRFDDHLRIDGVASYVRGKRRDIDDDLYRIAPPRLTLVTTYEGSNWSIALEGTLVSRQTHISQTNSEIKTGGYATFGVMADWRVRDGVAVSAGIENVFDNYYEEHLAGYNRVASSDVTLGGRLPGAGRSGFIRLNVAY